jgi:TIR domain
MRSVVGDIFLSYAREDLAVAAKLAELLEQNGLTVWWDRRLVAGDDITGVIDRALQQAKVAVVLWSPNSVSSRWVCGEAETAAEANKLIPVRISDCKLPLSFRGLHTPDVYKSKEQLLELADLLSHKLSCGAPQEKKLQLTDTSTNRFIDDFRVIIKDQSLNLGEQVLREWQFGMRHPMIYWGGGLAAYFVSVWSLSALLGLDFSAANAVMGAISLILYFVYRHYRLSRRQ